MLDKHLKENLFPTPGMGYGNLRPPWIEPPPGFVHVDRNAVTTVTIGSGKTLLQRIQLTESYEGYIVKAGIFASSYQDFFFSIEQGGIPLRDYSRVQVPLGQSDQMDPLGPLKIVANEPWELYANAGAGAANIIGIRYRIYGWYYQPKPGNMR